MLHKYKTMYIGLEYFYKTTIHHHLTRPKQRPIRIPVKSTLLPPFLLDKSGEGYVISHHDFSRLQLLSDGPKSRTEKGMSDTLEVVQ